MPLIIRRLLLFLILPAAMLLPENAAAFPTDVYASQSVLSEGRWVKVSVKETGMYFIPASSLKAWGFSNPEKVKIHGYGGSRLSDYLTQSDYIDDLPEIQILRYASGIYFYAIGPESWTRTSSGNYYHSLNPFSSAGYYYLTDRDADSADRQIPQEGFDAVTSTPLTVFTERLFHEQDLVSPGQTGHQLVGEDFRITRSRTFNFSLPDRVDGTDGWIRASFVAASSGRSTASFTVNGSSLAQNAVMAAVNSYVYATSSTISTPFDISGDKLTLGIDFATQGVATLANLDAITINYTRAIRLRDGMLQFRVNRPSVTLEGATASTIVWDVTDPLKISAINTIVTNGGVEWTNTYNGERDYVAWDPGCRTPAPDYEETICNQNLHGETTAPDMVIITPRDWIGEANRLARHHAAAPDLLEILVVDQDEIFNEFASGSRDVNAIRRYLKMIYDRGAAAGHPLRYVLLFGRATFDNRALTAEMAAINEPFIPTWQSDDGLSQTTSFTTDDILAMLDDDSGANLSASSLSVAIGRAPIRSLTEAKAFVDKIIAYPGETDSDWKNRVVMLADNGDSGVFMKDSELQYENFRASSSGSDMFYDKVYIDAFDIINGECQGGRKRLHRLIDEGIVWFNYIGHGDRNSLAEEDVLTAYDITHMKNRRWPLLFAATCSFAMHDGASPSGAETLLMTPKVGMIACVAPTRQAMITHNGSIAAVFGQKAFERDDAGRFRTIGEICRVAKNSMVSSMGTDVNRQKLYYVLLGDPAMRLATPEQRVVLEQIDDKEVSDDSQCTVMALQRPVFSGAIYDLHGNLMDDFNGTITLTLYDAEQSTTSNGATTGGSNPTEGARITFEEQGEKLYVGCDSVKNGRFYAQIAMPGEIAGNFRPAALNMYAVDSDGREAIGCNRQFYVYGYDDSAELDSIPPSIDYAYLNHDSFTPGTTVNESPVFIAGVSDNVGINLSSAGVGHSMSLKIDGKNPLENVALYYTPSSDGTPSGTITYPIESLSEGNHTLTFKVWDTSGNSASRTIDFNVRNGASPKIFDIYTDVNPASTETNFYLNHDRPDAMLTVTLDVYDMLGHRVWTTTSTDRSYIYSSAPIHWDLTDMSGRRLPRGIYIYRATVITDGIEATSAAKRIAITSP